MMAISLAPVRQGQGCRRTRDAVSPFGHGGGPRRSHAARFHPWRHRRPGRADVNPDTAALDPIFWLHHANIDRLWSVWIARDQKPQSHRSVTAQRPCRSGVRDLRRRRRRMCRRSHRMSWIRSNSAIYDDLSIRWAARRGARRGCRISPPRRCPPCGSQERADRSEDGAYGCQRYGREARRAAGRGQVKLAAAGANLAGSFTPAKMQATTPGEPDRVFLNLERYPRHQRFGDLRRFPGAQGRCGSEADAGRRDFLFGLESATGKNGPHGGSG